MQTAEPLQVVLDREELRWASDVGAQRLAQTKGDPRFAYTSERSGLETHAIGCMGELAFAKALGLEWPARVNTHRELPDVDPFWEVRWDSKLGRVKVATDDKPYMLVAHVTGRPPGFEVHGYINAGWVQQNVPKTDPPDRNGVPRGRYAHFTDIYHLSPINSEFHATCAWINGYGPLEGWICLFCGARRET